MRDLDENVNIYEELKDLFLLLIGAKSVNGEPSSNDIVFIFFFSLLVLAFLTSIKYQLARYRSKLEQRKKQHPSNISHGLSFHCNTGYVEDTNHLRAEIIQSKEHLQNKRKKTRKELQNEYEELTSMQNQLKNDLDELKGLLSAVQKIAIPKAKQT